MSFLAKLGKFLFFLMVIAILSGIIYYNRANYKVAYENARLAVGLDKPCEKPITYSIGQLDAQFGQSQEELEANMEKATAIWDSAFGKKLFQYSNAKEASSKPGELTVNLIFDSRQKNTETLNDLNSTIESGKGDYTELKARYTSLQNSYNSQKNNLDNMIATYEAKKSAYEKDIAYWNSRGGANKSEFATLEQRRIALNIEASSLNTASKQFNITVNSLNAVVKELNSLSKNINQTVGTYNTVSTANGPEFQEGEYVSDKDGERINIYQYSNQAKLIRVLAHEFGHALGLDHVADPKAIMYAYNMDSNMQLTTDDIVALKGVCETK